MSLTLAISSTHGYSLSPLLSLSSAVLCSLFNAVTTYSITTTTDVLYWATPKQRMALYCTVLLLLLQYLSLTVVYDAT